MSKTFIVETSARHVHVTQEHLEILFGKGYELTKKKDLSQPGQFACEERVTVVGPKRNLPAFLSLVLYVLKHRSSFPLLMPVLSELLLLSENPLTLQDQVPASLLALPAKLKSLRALSLQRDTFTSPLPMLKNLA